MDMIEICQYMKGWDYYTYMNQPTWFLELIRLKRNIDGKYQQWLTRKSKR
jgi:hypothetical protein